MIANKHLHYKHRNVPLSLNFLLTLNTMAVSFPCSSAANHTPIKFALLGHLSSKACMRAVQTLGRDINVLIILSAINERKVQYLEVHEGISATILLSTPHTFIATRLIFNAFQGRIR